MWSVRGVLMVSLWPHKLSSVIPVPQEHHTHPLPAIVVGQRGEILHEFPADDVWAFRTHWI